MSDAFHHDLNEWDHVLNQLERQWAVREQVSTTLKEANAAFAAQFTQPDAYKFVETCDQLAKFLGLKIHMEESEQKLVVQILQVACAMHENAVNNPALSKTERSAHYLASTSLVPLCKSALEGGVTRTELWCEVLNLSLRAEKALSNATDALDLSKYLDFGKMTDDYLCESGNGASEASIAPSSVPTASRSATPRVSKHDVTDVRQTPRSAKFKEKALVLVKDGPSKGVPLGRAHTMPSVSQATSSPYNSRTGQTPSKAQSRGNGLHRVQEMGE